MTPSFPPSCLPPRDSSGWNFSQFLLHEEKSQSQCLPAPATHGCGRLGSQLSPRPDVTIREMGSPGPLKRPWRQRSRPCPLTECRSRRRGTPTGRSRVSGTPGFSGWIIYAVPTHDRTGGWGWGSQALARLSERRDRDSHTRGFRTERPAPSWA